MYIYREPEFPPVSKFKLPGTFTQEQVDGFRDFILKFPFMSYAAGLPYTEIRSINVPAEDYYISINAPIDHFFRGGFINLTTGKVYSLFDDYHNYLPEPDVWDMAWGTSQGTYDQTGGIALTLQVGANGIYVNPDMSVLYQDATLYAECQSEEVNMNIITGYRGEPHITAAQDRAQNQGCYGEGSYVLDVGNKLAATSYSATEIHVADGVLSHQGCVGVIDSGTYDVVEIDGGTQGYKRKDLIVCRYEKDSNTYEESLTIMAIKGTPTTGSTPATPSYISGDIQGGDLVVDMPLYEVLINGVSVSSITLVASRVRTQAELDSGLATAVNDISGLSHDLGTLGTTVQGNSSAITAIQTNIGILDDQVVMTTSDNLLSANKTIAAGTQVYESITMPTKNAHTLIGVTIHALTGSSNAKVMAELDMNGYLKLFNTHTASITITSVTADCIWKKNVHPQ